MLSKDRDTFYLDFNYWNGQIHWWLSNSVNLGSQIDVQEDVCFYCCQWCVSNHDYDQMLPQTSTVCFISCTSFSFLDVLDSTSLTIWPINFFLCCLTFVVTVVLSFFSLLWTKVLDRLAMKMKTDLKKSLDLILDVIIGSEILKSL